MAGSGTSRGTSGRRSPGRRLGRIVGVLAAILAANLLILAADAARTMALDPPDPPTTNVVNHDITWARNPEEKAKQVELDATLMKHCREASFVVVTFSGTGMEDSHYQANMIQPMVEDLGGCIMYHWYGHRYDAAASARSVENAVADVTASGKRKPVVFLGASFGGIAAEDVATDPVVRESKAIEVKKIVMIATPVDMNDVIQDVFTIPVPAIKDIPLQIPPFGGLVVLGNAINGQRQRGQLADPEEWRHTFVNAEKTRAVLMWSQLQRLRRGMLIMQTDVPIDYLASPGTDHTVNTDQAYQRIDSVIEAETRYFIIEGGGHDRGWLLSTADKYNVIIGPILQEMFGATG